MSYTAAQVTDLRRAIASGALTVRNANGETVTYRSLTEMRSILATMEAEVGAVTRPKVGVVQYVRD